MDIIGIVGSSEAVKQDKYFFEKLQLLSDIMFSQKVCYPRSFVYDKRALNMLFS